MPLALFGLLERLPFGFLSILSLILIVTFYYLLDSGSLVVGYALRRKRGKSAGVAANFLGSYRDSSQRCCCWQGARAFTDGCPCNGLPLAIVLLLAVGFGLYTALSRESPGQARYEGSHPCPWRPWPWIGGAS